MKILLVKIHTGRQWMEFEFNMHWYIFQSDTGTMRFIRQAPKQLYETL